MIDWSKITSSQFEEIACFYARDIYKEFTWIPTKKTHDGNRDGEFEGEVDAIQLFYKGWYEAKYTSDPNQSIPKSHMDSTLVSGILDGFVAYIVFITNGRITKEFRRRAKAILMPHKINVDFIDGEMLESWILNKPDIYKRFWNEQKNSIPLMPTILIDDICFFDGYMTPSVLIAPIAKLQIDNEYFLYISVRSNIHTRVRIQWDSNSLFMVPSKECQSFYSLVPGFNLYMIKVCAKLEISDKLVIKLSDECGNVAKYTYDHFVIEDDDEPHITYSSQTAIIQQIFNYTINVQSPNLLFSIVGKSGHGKSYLLKRVALNIIQNKMNLLMIEFSDKSGENAVAICKLILFLNFGDLYAISDEAFAILIKDRVNLPTNIYQQLKEGCTNQIVAINVINRLVEIVKNPAYSILIPKNILSGEISYIVIDDLHKVTKDVCPIIKSIITDFKRHSYGQIMLLGYRENEFTASDLETLIISLCDRKLISKSISRYDVSLSMKENFSERISEIADIFPLPVNVMHLYLLIRKLKQKEIQKMPTEKQLLYFKKAYIETNLQNGYYAKQQIETCQYKGMLYLIYKIESGIPIHLLAEYFGDSFYSQYQYLLEERYIKKDADTLKPFHDVYLYAFLGMNYDSKYINSIEEFLKICMPHAEEFPILISNILSLLISDSYRAKLEYRESLYSMCNKYFDKCQYIAAKKIALALISDIDNIDAREYDVNDLDLLFIYAQSIKYAESHIEADRYLDYICKIGDSQRLTSNKKNITYEAHSELLNNAIWELDKKKSQQQIIYLEVHLPNSVETGKSHFLENAYLNLLNRKMLYNAQFESMSLYQELFEVTLNESKRLKREDYIGYALMDFAKSNMILDTNRSIKQLKEAQDIFEGYDHCQKRLYDCKSEIIFLSAICDKKDYDELYDVQQITYSKGFGHAYMKTSLKILALEIVNGVNAETVGVELDKLMLQYPDSFSKYRLQLFYYMLKSCVCYLQGDYESQQKWSKKQEEMSLQLSQNYIAIPLHNKNIVGCNHVDWYFPNSCSTNAFWIDPRIW